MSIQQVQEIRNKLGCGLREAKDAFDRYGSAEKAVAALSPKSGAPRDPYAVAVADRERWHAKSSEYRNGLQRIINSLEYRNDLSNTERSVLEMARAAMGSGDNL